MYKALVRILPSLGAVAASDMLNSPGGKGDMKQGGMLVSSNPIGPLPVEAVKTFEPDIDERYADSVLSGRLNEFVALVIHGVRIDMGDDGPTGHVEVNEIEPDYFSVYVMNHDGTSESVGDHGTLRQAEEYAFSLSTEYGWEVANCVSIHVGACMTTLRQSLH